VLGVGGILFDVAEEAAEAFGPLKAALGAISTIYEKYEVRLRPLSQNRFLTKPPAGNSCRQEEDPRPLLTHNCVGDDLRNTYKRRGGEEAPGRTVTVRHVPPLDSVLNSIQEVQGHRGTTAVFV